MGKRVAAKHQNVGLCEFCGDPIDSVAECEQCGAEVHELCIDTTIEHGAMCPYCYEQAIDPAVLDSIGKRGADNV